jgi:hypothetical protein
MNNLFGPPSLTPDLLKGKFHAHITLLTDDNEFIAPSGWKTTIILLAKGDRNQKDVMITRHYVSDTIKTPGCKDMVENIELTSKQLTDAGHTVIRKKLEHESLPTVDVSPNNYRECHVKIRKKVGDVLHAPEGFVQSRNAMEVVGDTEIVFLNARYYKGQTGFIDYTINKEVSRIVNRNANKGVHVEVLETKIESTVYDTNLALDKWWA